MPPTRSSARSANINYSSSSRNATIRRPPVAASTGKPSIRLTVKAPPSKLRQALNSSDDIPPNPYNASPEAPARNARSTRNPRKVVDPDSEEEDEDEDMEDAEGDELGPEDEDDEDNNEEGEEDDGEDEEEEDAEGEDDDEDPEEDAEDDADEDADEDVDADTSVARSSHPHRPVIRSTKIQQGAKKAKIGITVSAPPEGTLKSVEEKEAEMEGLSDLDDEEDEEEEEDLDSDGERLGSRSGTPDLAKLTRRQRGAYEESLDGDNLLALSNEAQKKKQLTAEEHAMRRAEMARRRKNLSEKRNEEEKMDTINKLLKKPAPKRRSRAEMLAAASADTPGAEYGDEEAANPLYVRWVNTSAGSRLAVPTEILEAPAGEQLQTGWTRPPERQLVEEVQ